MTREEYLLLLAEAVERGAISEDDARQLLALFDAGQLDPNSLPLTTGDALATMRTPVDADEGDGNEALAALLLLLALLGSGKQFVVLTDAVLDSGAPGLPGQTPGEQGASGLTVVTMLTV